jgi:hypothetical protein
MRAAWSTLLVPVLLASLVLQGDGNEATHAAATLPVEPWAPATSATATVQDLHREYDQVFKHGNRNAASHRWSSFLLDRAGQMTAERLNMLFSGFCAVSGSIVNPNDYNRYRLTLPKVGGGYSTGYMHYCCWPCVCDTQDFIRVDTKNVTSSDATRTLEFAVIGNPCDHPEKLHEPFMDIFDQYETSIAASAQEVRCLPGGVLEGATMSDHGYVIISRFFESADASDAADGTAPGALAPIDVPTPGRASTSPAGEVFQDEREYATMCSDRADNGYNSGMGEIFRKVCSVSPISPAAVTHDVGGHTCEEGNESACAAEQI